MSPMHVERREPRLYIAAAVHVLAAAGGPLTAREIAEETMGHGLIRPDGPRPATTPATRRSPRRRRARAVPGLT